jgi:hypothetical protein
MKDTNVGGLMGRCADALEPFEEDAAVGPEWSDGKTLGRVR